MQTPGLLLLAAALLANTVAAASEGGAGGLNRLSTPVVTEASLKEVLRRVASNNAHMERSAVPRLTSQQLTRAMQLGNMERLRVALSRMASGAPSLVAVVGGSITYGLGTGDGLSYAERLKQWLAVTFPQRNVQFANGGAPAVDPSYMALCVTNHVPLDADIVFVEFATNDSPTFDHPMITSLGVESGPRQNFERLLRRLMRYPKHPAVVLLNAFSWHNMPLPGKFWYSAETSYLLFSQYYGLPSLSVRAAAYQNMMAGEPGYGVANMSLDSKDEAWSDLFFYSDTHHPRLTTGHAVFADLAVAMLVHGLKSLAHRAVTAEEQEQAKHLPAPLLPSVGDTQVDDMCLVGAKLRDLLAATQGFEWKNEGPVPDSPKLGFTGLARGSWLELRVNTMLGMPGMEFVPVHVGHLRSYEHMGQALIECVKGCACTPVTQDGHHQYKFSQTYTTVVLVQNQTRDCHMRVTILDSTSSGEHKVRITSIMVSEATDRETLAHMSSNPSVGIAVDFFTNMGPATKR